MEVLIKTGLFDNSQSDFVLPLQFGYTTTTNDVVDSPEESDGSEDTSKGVSSEYPSTQLSSTREDTESNVLLEEQRLEELIAKIKEDAYRDGYAESILDVKAKYNEQFEKIDSLIAIINEALPSYLKKNEPVIASIVFESVCKIIGEELANKQKSISVVEHTIRAIDKDRIQEILISQEDFNSIENLNSELSSDGVVLESVINQFIFKADPEINYGGCKIKLIDGFLDASIDGQLKALSKSLKAKADDLAR